MAQLLPPFVFPNNLPGLTWPITKVLTNQTRIRRALSSREERAADYVPQAISGVISLATNRPIWQFELPFAFLRGAAGSVRMTNPAQSRGPYTGAGYNEIGILHGFVTSTRGPFFPFFYDDPTDNTVVGGALGTGDNASTNMQLVRFFGDPTGTTPGFYEPITAPRVVSAVYINGNIEPEQQWSLDKTVGIVSFPSAVSTSQTVTADFTFWHRCRFADDAPADIEEFMYLLHSVKSLKFLTALGDSTGAPT